MTFLDSSSGDEDGLIDYSELQRQARILVAEGNSFLRRTLRWWLKTKFPQCYVVEASDEDEAAALIKTFRPDIVIVDNSLPARNCIEFVTSIKAIAPTVRVLVLTFYEDEIHYASKVANGVTAYISHENIQTKLQPTLVTLLAAQH